MVCYSNKTKANCAKVVGVISTIMFILGVLVAVFGAMQMGAIPTPKKDGKDFTKGLPDLKSYGLGIVALGVLSVLVGILGCCTAKSKKCLCAGTFIILAMIMGLVCLIFSFVALGGTDLVAGEG
jgi:hypothetical protein